jgi:hypothetical protein
MILKNLILFHTCMELDAPVLFAKALVNMDVLFSFAKGDLEKRRTHPLPRTKK